MSSSLVNGSSLVGEYLCPKRPYWVRSADDYAFAFPASCDSYRCEQCGPANVRRRVAIAAWSLRQADRIRHITLTLAPETWQHTREQIKDFVRRLRKTHKIEAAWARERNPRETGYHIHMMTYGQYIRQTKLKALWGGRRVWINEIDTRKGGYIAKVYQMSGYMVKEVSLQDHLDRNGGRGMHFTGGFLRGWTQRDVMRYMSKGVHWIPVIGKALDIAEYSGKVDVASEEHGDAYEGD